MAKAGTTPALSLTQTYTYDSLNRLASAREATTANNSQTFKQVYTYTDENGDGGEYGNLRLNWAQTSANVKPEQSSQVPSISAATNRITSEGYGYDAAGNMTQAPDKVMGAPGHSYTYDAENRMQVFDAGRDHETVYTYDGEGRRVKKVIGIGSLAVTSTYVYDAVGKLIAEYATNTAGSELGTRYLTADTLGSTRIVTDGSKVVTTQAAANSAVKARYDYLPFGEEINASIGGRSGIPGYVTSDTTRQKFTKYERDKETGLDYAKARYYGNSFGRFISPDPLKASGKPALPQSWDRYTYCLNNPLVLVDPSGKIWVWHYVNSKHSQVGYSWFSGRASQISTSLGKSFHAVQFNGSDSKTIHLIAGGLATLNANSPHPTYSDMPQPSQSDALPSMNQALVHDIARRTEPTGRTILTLEVAAVGLGINVAGTPLVLANSAAAGVTAYKKIASGNDASDRETIGGINKDSRGGRGRLQSGEDNLDQLDGVTNYRDNRGTDPTGYRPNIDKSEQRVDHTNDRIQNYEQAIEEYGESMGDIPGEP